jgi:hypothetical protein
VGSSAGTPSSAGTAHTEPPLSHTSEPSAPRRSITTRAPASINRSTSCRRGRERESERSYREAAGGILEVLGQKPGNQTAQRTCSGVPGPTSEMASTSLGVKMSPAAQRLSNCHPPNPGTNSQWVTRFAASRTTVRSPRKLNHSLTLIRLIQYFDSSAHGLVRRWLLTGAVSLST